MRAITHVEGKPFSYPELRARVEALLRRADVRRRPGRLRVGELEIDAAARVVRLRGTPVELSQKEFALVRTLASDPTRVFTTKDELLRTIWGFRTLGSNRRKVRLAHGRSSPLPPSSNRSS
jgi:DNA-binding response OmpR family regulator